jgi:hypothetical protein
LESDLNQAVFAQVFNDSGEIIFKEQPISLPGPLGRPEKTPAGIRFLGFLVGMLQNEYFNAAAAFFATENPRRNHPGVVDHQEVAGQEQLREIKKMPIFHIPGRAVHNQEARVIPLRERDLSDQFLRQVVVVVFNVEHQWNIPKTLGIGCGRGCQLISRPCFCLDLCLDKGYILTIFCDTGTSRE